MNTKLRLRLPLAAAAVLGLASLSRLGATTVNNGYYFARTASAGCDYNSGLCVPVYLPTVGTTAWGGYASPGFHGSAATSWFEDQFGLYARADANTIGAGGSSVGWADGALYETVFIPPPAGVQLGDPGIFSPIYHLEGTVNIDWAGTNGNGGQVNLNWGVQACVPIVPGYCSNGTITYQANVVDESWRADHLSVQFDRIIAPAIPFHYGESFLYSYGVVLSASVGSSAPPSVGYAEGDFFHTGTLTGVTVLDKFGNPISNPVILTESGFDFANPQGAVVAPEPSSALLLAGGLAAFLLVRRRRGHIS